MQLIYGLLGKWKLVCDKDEFIQTGRIALFDAWSRYDGERGTFAAYERSYVYRQFQLNERTAGKRNSSPREQDCVIAEMNGVAVSTVLS